MIALITYSLKKATKQNQILIFVCLCICDPYIHMNIIVAKKKKHQKTRTLSSAEKSQLNSVASCSRFSKDRLEQVQKHMM